MRIVEVTPHSSGTPTFWRQLLLFAPDDELSACRLEQITMGGEAVTQGLLDQLSGLFPQTRLVHIYASTELGRLFSVTDKRAGFPPLNGSIGHRRRESNYASSMANSWHGRTMP